MANRKVILMAGTRKGLLIFTSSDRRRWEVDGGICLPGKEINHAVQDPRTGIIYATLNDPWFGGEIVRTEDMGRTWKSSQGQPGLQPGVRPGRGAAVAHRAGGRKPTRGPVRRRCAGSPFQKRRQRGDLAGGERPDRAPLPLDLARWRRRAHTPHHPCRPKRPPATHRWSFCRGSVRHRGRRNYLEPPEQRGIRTEELPERFPESGQCVHKIVMAPDNPSSLFAQGHWGDLSQSRRRPVVARDNERSALGLRICDGRPSCGKRDRLRCPTPIGRFPMSPGGQAPSLAHSRRRIVLGAPWQRAAPGVTHSWAFTESAWQRTLGIRPGSTWARIRANSSTVWTREIPGMCSQTTCRLSLPFLLGAVD